LGQRFEVIFGEAGVAEPVEEAVGGGAEDEEEGEGEKDSA
jgi:hypothetical protein